MSTEDDIAKIAAVTEKLTGPMRVWVLYIDDRANGNDEHISLCYTREKALQLAEEDMLDVEKHAPEVVQREMVELRNTGSVRVGDVEYRVMDRQVKS